MLEIPTSPTYGKNLERSGNRAGMIPCVVCGKGIVQEKARYWLRVFWGNTAVTPSEARAIIAREGYGGDTGGYPVGTDCLRQHPELKAYVNLEDTAT